MKQEHITQVMNDPIAQKLLNAAIPARLAYAGLDGSQSNSTERATVSTEACPDCPPRTI